MPRIARVVAAGLPHHITQRGNYRQAVFSDNEDRLRYLSWIEEYSHKYKLSMLTYCLMQNHVHFIAVPQNADSLARVFNTAHMRYSQYFNKKLKTNGHLWQGRFYSCALDEPHLILACRYVERNPVRMKIVKKPWQWGYSSALAHIDAKSTSPIKLKNLFDILDMTPESWKKYIDSSEESASLNKIRSNTLTGRPLGGIDFVKQMEKRFQRRLLALPRGRPKEETREG